MHERAAPGPLNVNLTVPLISLIRVLCESPLSLGSDIDEIDELHKDPEVVTSETQGQLRLSNQTGSVIWYRLIQPDGLISTAEQHKYVSSWFFLACTRLLCDSCCL